MRDRRMIVGLVCAALLFLGIGQVSAQVRLGVKGGLNIASVHFSTDVLQSDNVTGFQIGPMGTDQPFAGRPELWFGLDQQLQYGIPLFDKE